MIDLSTMSLLIVDDMDSMRRSIRGMFKVMKMGKTVRYASNGYEAWKILQSTPIDMAIIDWNMPVMTGIELLNKIRDSKELRDMPVIMITAEALQDIVAEAAETDIDAYILKPLSIQSLEEKIRQVVEQANNPSPLALHMRAAREHEEEDRIDEAIAEVKKAVMLKPNLSRVLRKLGLLYLEKGREDFAERCLLKAVASNEKDSLSRYYLGEFYLKREDLENTVKYFSEAMRISPRNSRRGMQFGRILIESGMYEKASEIFDLVIKNAAEARSFSEEIIELSMAKGNYAYALKLLQQQLSQDPENPDLLIKAGTAYEKTGDDENALECLVGADRIERGNIDLKLSIAKIYMKKRKVFIADEYLNAVLNIDPAHEEAIRLRRENN